MEPLLFNLFDLQRFENNEQLASLIRETGSRYSGSKDMGFRKLSDEELSMAAGGCIPTSFSPSKRATDTEDEWKPQDVELNPLRG